jgi:opacity protein-like surface antigen
MFAPTLIAVPLVAIALLVFPLAGAAAAQDNPPPAVEFEAGWVGFADDGIANEAMVGGTARWYLSPRLGIGPELVYVSGSNHSHLIVTGNVTFDILSPATGRPRPVTPFLVAGGGWFQTRETFNSGDFTSSEGAFTAGGGVRAAAGDRVTIGIDARVGWELHIRVNGFVGIRLGR